MVSSDRVGVVPIRRQYITPPIFSFVLDGAVISNLRNSKPTPSQDIRHQTSIFNSKPLFLASLSSNHITMSHSLLTLGRGGVSPGIIGAEAGEAADNAKKHPTTKKGAIIGIIIGVVCLLMFGIWAFWADRRK
jgi:hypothetical protein